MVFREMPEWTPKPIVSAAATGVGPRALAGFCLSQRNSCSSLEHRFLALHRFEIAADSRWAPLRLERHAGPQEDGSGASSWRELELDSVSYLVFPGARNAMATKKAPWNHRARGCHSCVAPRIISNKRGP